MDRLQRATLPTGAVIGDALTQLRPGVVAARGRQTCFQVLTEAGALAGLLTETDIIRAACAAVGDVALERVSAYMKPTESLVCVSVEQYTSASGGVDVSCLMAHRKIKHLPVLDAAQKPVGVVDSLQAASDLYASLMTVRVRGSP